MKNLIYLTLALVIVTSCSSDNNDEQNQIPQEDIISAEPSVRPYSCNVTTEGIDIVYKTTGAATINAIYREQFSDNWVEAEAVMETDQVTVSLRNLATLHYYQVIITVQNDLGQSATDNFVVQYDYATSMATIYAQPFMQWGADVDDVKVAMADKGNILYWEANNESSLVLTYRFMYKEISSEYYFDAERKLKEIMVFFDKNRVNQTELRRYIILAFGYLTFGNIHLNIGGEDQHGTLFKTAEGSSYVILYEKDERVIVDYMSTASINPSEIQYR